MRRSEPFTGGEKITQKPKENRALTEIAVILLIAISVSLLFMLQPPFLREYFESSSNNRVLKLFLILAVSPFGAHLISIGLSRIAERIIGGKI